MEQVQADIQRNKDNQSKIANLKSAQRNKTIEYDKVNKSVNEYKQYHSQLQGDANMKRQIYKAMKIELMFNTTNESELPENR